MSQKPRAFYTVDEVAKIDRVNRFTAFKRVVRGEIPGAKKHGRFWRIVKSTFLKQRGITEDDANQVLDEAQCLAPHKQHS